MEPMRTVDAGAVVAKEVDIESLFELLLAEFELF